MPQRNFGARLRALFVVLALGSAVSVRMAQGQEISFLREFEEFTSANGVAVDATGVYVTGGENYGFVRKYDLDDNELWTRTFDVRSHGAKAIAVNDASVYVLGFVESGFHSGSSSFLRKYDAGGNQLWIRQFSGIGNSVAANATGIYVVFFVHGSAPEGFLRKYSGDGEELWTRSLSSDWPDAVAVDATGVYVAGSGFLHKYSDAGEKLWTRRFPDTIYTSVAVEATGVYVAGHGVLRKYDSSGGQRWVREYDWSSLAQSETGYLRVAGVAADPSGVYIVGGTDFALADHCRSGLEEDAFVRKYDPAGVSLWTRQFSGSLDSASANGVAVSASGVYVASVSRRCGAGPCDFRALLAKLEGSQPVISDSGPRILPGCVVNAANYVGGRVAPGEIVTIFGREIGPEAPNPALVEGSRLTTSLAGTRVLVDGVAAPLLYVSGSQINAIIPYAVAERPTVNVEVEYQGVRSNIVTMPVTTSRPGIFTRDGSGSGHALALNEDGSINSSSNPAGKNSIVTFFATGEGLIEPAVGDGLILGSVPPKPKESISVLFCCSYFGYGLWEGDILYAGGVPGSAAGLLQVNVQMPGLDTPSVGEGFQLCIGGQCSGFNQLFIKP
jgi:uncharacterized protein (TIGR03437 family)